MSRNNFNSKIGAILAAAGSAVGLGNVWRFPTEVGNNGGAAFILIYILCLFAIGMPVMLCEFIIGRNTHTNAITAFSRLAPGSWWRIGGVEGVFVAFLILSYYVVVSGWTLFYTVESFSGAFVAPMDYGQFFSDFVSDPWLPLIYAMLFMLMTHVVIARGVQRGIERFSKIMMPLLLFIIVVLVCCTITMPGVDKGLSFMFKPDFSKVTTSVFLNALGQAFFSLSLAMGCLTTYASYFGPQTKLLSTASSVIVIDTIVAVMSGVIIFPAVFSVGVEPGAGPGLVFITLPHVFLTAFDGMPVLGYVFSGLFYLLLFLAALTSAMSLHEPVTAWVHESMGISRHAATSLVSVMCMSLGVVCALSFGILGDWHLFGMTVFDLFDYVASTILMPLGGLVIALFVGWRLSRKIFYSEITNTPANLLTDSQMSARIPRFIFFLVRWVAPLFILLIFLNGILK